MTARDETLRLEKIFDVSHPAFNLARFGSEIAELRKCTDFTVAWKSLGCAQTGWQMHEWFWKLSDAESRARMVRYLGEGSISSSKQFGLAMQRHDKAIAICRQIGTVSKHLSVEFPDEELRTTIHLGDGKDGDPLGHFVQIWVKGEPFRDAEVYESAFQAWATLFKAAELSDWSEVADAIERTNRRRAPN